MKGTSNLSSSDFGVGQFRSVVWNKDTNTPVCMAPAKAKKDLPPMNTMLASVEDFVDGFMVNAFVVGNEASAQLHVATRTVLGGTNRFYSEKTFGQMFEEAVAASPLRSMDELKKQLLSKLQEEKGTAAFASFVVQHPEHRIVAKVVSPGLHVVHVGVVNETGAIKIHDTADAVFWPNGLQRLQISSYPTREFHSEGEVNDMLRKISATRGWRWQGLVFKDRAGNRWRVRTPTYTMLRDLRGSEAKATDRFLRLRTNHKVNDYLKHYSEDRNEFWTLEQQFRARTGDILAAYRDVHLAHVIKFGELTDVYKPAVYRLHVLYLNELRPKNYTVRLQNAIDVMAGLKDFEQKRLMEAAPYVALAPARVKEDVSGAAVPTTE
jgi:hypothetical protein